MTDVDQEAKTDLDQKTKTDLEQIARAALKELDELKSRRGILTSLVGTPKNDSERDAQTVGSALAWALAVGSLFAVLWQPRYWAAACLWGYACALVGMLIGFLFGIPRFLTRAGTVVTPQPNNPVMAASSGQPLSQQVAPATNATGNGQPVAQQTTPATSAAGNGQPLSQPSAALGSINTNLEEISDWLTKIIVGVSLVELQKARMMLLDTAGFIAQTLGGPSQTSFAYALMMYFLVAGFLGSYLLTRLYLQIAFRNAAARS